MLFYIFIALIFLIQEIYENGEIDYIETCGEGGTGCFGSLWNLTCKCDKAEGYAQSSDGKKCIARKLNDISVISTFDTRSKDTFQIPQFISSRDICT